MLFSKVLASGSILLVGVSAQSQSTESEQMRILPITTGTLTPDVPFSSVTVTGVMSIPQGETPLTTDLLPTPSITGLPTGGSITSITRSVTSGSGSGSSPPTTSSSTAAAPAVFVAGDGIPSVLALALSGMSMALGFAWILL